jgi:hypothetical protein
MTWVLIAGITWLALAPVVAIVVARVVRQANHPSAPPWLDEVDRLLPRDGDPRRDPPGLTGLPAPRHPAGGRRTTTR